MSCKNFCSGKDLNSTQQPFPIKGLLKSNLNLNIEELINKVQDQNIKTIYAYVLTTIEYSQNEFVQTGCAPNYQGEFITLFTCKRYMRSFHTKEYWKNNVWIAGITGSNSPMSNKLFYFMKVKETFISQFEAWNYFNVSIRKDKSASCNFLGDLYEPKFADILIEEQFDVEKYIKPKNHVHLTTKKILIEETEYYRDLNYMNRFGGRQFYLLGDPNYSFLWSKPLIKIKSDSHPRTKKYNSFDSFKKTITKNSLL